MAKQLVIFTKEELLKLLDGGPVEWRASEDLPEIIFYSEDGWLTFCDWIKSLSHSELITGKEYEVEE